MKKMNPATRFKMFMLLGCLMGLSLCMVIAPVWETTDANTNNSNPTPPHSPPPSTVPVSRTPHASQNTAQQNHQNKQCTKRDIRIAETKDQYVCSYMKSLARPEGGPGCVVDCDGFQGKCSVLTAPTQSDLATADAVIYHPGRKLPVVKGNEKQWSVMWYGESEEKHPEMYEERNLKKYNAHVIYKKWSRYRFSWTQRFRKDFENLESVKKKWIPWRDRRAAVAIVSNCKYHTTNRTAVMEEIDKLLQKLSNGKEKLYMYGSCHPSRGKDSIRAEHPECKVKSDKDRYKEKLCVMRHYKYAISLDNSRDGGYVTEKVYHALLAGAVPLYAGAPDIFDYVPLPSAILPVPTSKSLVPLVSEMLAADTPPQQTEWWDKPFSPAFIENMNLPNSACTICKDIACGDAS
eukprot:TRINITY_DN31247_c0_g1_i1.p1 TRINITY_DN31247_c0_g1~~TRINITY_DN31247_c0_g1_i1.p1  ORF type:complete len:405 (+),score=70.04 TRINITY_DN31247_c0_g1_i1:50-1264(+)